MDQEVIYKALRGEATPDELEQVARWHSENPEDFQRCADEVHMQIDMMELYGEEIRPASWIAVHWRKVVRITVQAAAMLAIGLFVGGYISKERTYDMLAEQINTLQVPYGQRLKFTLPDGSSVQLNSGAKIEYPSVFKKNLRRVKFSHPIFGCWVRNSTLWPMSATNAFRLHCSKVGCKLQTGSIPRKKTLY